MFRTAGDTIVFSVKLACAARSNAGRLNVNGFSSPLGRSSLENLRFIVIATLAAGNVSDRELLPVIEASVNADSPH